MKMEPKLKFVLKELIPITFTLGILLGGLLGFYFGSKSTEVSNLGPINVFDQNNAGIIQQSCECEMVRKGVHSSITDDYKHPLKLNKFGEFQIDIKLRGFGEQDFVYIMFTCENETSICGHRRDIFMIKIGLYENQSIIFYNYNSTLKHDVEVASTVLDLNENDYTNNPGPQVKDWRSFLIKFNFYDTSVQIIEAPTGQMLLESIVPQNFTLINSYDIISTYGVQIARSCSYFSSHEQQVFNGERYILQQVTTSRDDEITVVEEFFCEQ